MQFERRKADLAMFKERAEALQRAVVILEEGIAASKAQVAYSTSHAWSSDCRMSFDWLHERTTLARQHCFTPHEVKGCFDAVLRSALGGQHRVRKVY